MPSQVPVETRRIMRCCLSRRPVSDVFAIRICFDASSDGENIINIVENRWRL